MNRCETHTLLCIIALCFACNSAAFTDGGEITLEFPPDNAALPYVEQGFTFDRLNLYTADVYSSMLRLIDESIVRMNSNNGLPFQVVSFEYTIVEGFFPPTSASITLDDTATIPLPATGAKQVTFSDSLPYTTSFDFAISGVAGQLLIDNIVVRAPQTLYTSNNAAVIPEDGLGKVYTDTLALPAIVSVDSIAVDINHTFIGDVEISLFDPAGNEFLLTEGFEPDGTGGGSSDDLAGVYTFVESGGGFYNPVTGNPIGNVFPPGTYNAETWQAGPHCAGLWTMTIRDEFALDGGMINSWSIEGVPIVPTAGTADFNADCSVDQSDLGILLANFGNSLDDGLGTNVCGDTDCDGDVDQSDLGVLLADFGNTCPMPKKIDL